MNKLKLENLLKIFLYLLALSIGLPILVLFIWTFTARWPWPNLLPESYSYRSIQEVFASHSNIFRVIFSSIFISSAVALLSSIIAIMTSRALAFYNFFGKKLINFFSLLPLLVPGTVFAMGIHVVFLKFGLVDSFFGVILVHLIYTLPYSISIMTDLTHSVGKDLEIQAYVLGANPFKAFIHISFPALLPGILSSINMAFILSYSQYFLTLLIGGGKIKTLNILMVPFIGKGDRSLSSLYALVFIASTLVVVLSLELMIRFINNRKRRDDLNWD